MFMRAVTDEGLAQTAYIIGCQRTGEAIVVDPERDVERYIAIAEANDLRLTAATETHIHADFVSGVRELAVTHGAHAYLSAEGGPDWSYAWADDADAKTTLLKDGDTINVGAVELRAVHTPGHTPEHLMFVVTDRGGGADEPVGVITGDFLFVGDLGRPDLLETAAGEAGAMEPSARTLFKTARSLEALPDFTQVWPGHGAGSACGKDLGAVPASTIGYERRFNTALRAATADGATEAGFVDFILSGQPEPPAYFAEMKRVNKLGPAVLRGLPTPPRIAAAQLADFDARKVAIIDTRPWNAFRAGHLPGALSLPFRPSFCTDAGSLVRADEPIYIIAEDEQATREAVRRLVRIGLDDLKGWTPAGDITTLTDLATTAEVDVRRGADMIAAGGVRVLDVRRATEFAEGHIEGATQIAHTRLGLRRDDVPMDKPLLINCRSGARSARACAYLQRFGYDVTNLAGGFVAWAESQPTAQP